MTFCPPGPEERIKDSSKSLSATPRFSILADRAFSFSRETGMIDLTLTGWNKFHRRLSESSFPSEFLWLLPVYQRPELTMVSFPMRLMVV